MAEFIEYFTEWLLWGLGGWMFLVVYGMARGSGMPDLNWPWFRGFILGLLLGPLVWVFFLCFIASDARRLLKRLKK